MSETHWLAKRRLYKIYKCLLGTLALALMPIYNVYGYSYMDAYMEKPLLPLLNRLNVQIQSLLVLMTVFAKLKTSPEQHEKLCFQFRLLNLSTKEKQKNQAMLWLKSIGFISHFLIVFMGIKFRMERKKHSFLEIILLVYFYVVQYILQVKLFEFFYLLVKILDRMDDLLSNVEELFAKLPLNEWKLKWLLNTLSLIDEICPGLMNFYQFFIMALLLSFFISNTIFIYMVFLEAQQLTHLNFVTMFTVFMAFLRYFDIYLSIICCEKIQGKRLECIQYLRDCEEDSQVVSKFFFVLCYLSMFSCKIVF